MKNKFTTLISTIFLLLFTLMLIPPNTVYAGGGETNIGGENSSSSTHEGVLGGWNSQRSGYRMYIINDKGLKHNN